MSNVYPLSVGKRRDPFLLTRGSDKLNVKVRRVRTRLSRRRFPIKRRNCDTILRGSSDILEILGPIEEGHDRGQFAATSIIENLLVETQQFNSLL